MDCNLDVNSYVFRNIEETVGDIGKIDIHTGIGTVNQKFGSKNLGIISKLNEAFKEKVISYLAPTDNDLPGTIQVTLSDRIYRYYLKKYGKKAETKKGISELFEDNPELANIGTQEQYSQYLDTIFPFTLVKDIVYHGTDKLFETFDKLKRGESSGKGTFKDENNTPLDSMNAFFFSSDKQVSDIYSIISRIKQIQQIAQGLQLTSHKLEHGKKIRAISSELADHLKEKAKELSVEGLKDYIGELAKKYNRIDRELGEGFLNRYTNYLTLGKQVKDLKNKKQEILAGNYIHNSFSKKYPKLSIDFYDNKGGKGYTIRNTGKIEGLIGDKFANKIITELTSSEFDEFIAIGEERQLAGMLRMTELMKKALITPVVYRALLDIKTPASKDFEGKTFVDQWSENGAQYEASILTNNAVKGKQNDSVIFKNIQDPYLSNSYGVFEPEQIHILGSKQDIEGFNSFVNKGTIKNKEEGQLDLFNQNISKIDIDTVTLSKSGMVTIGKNSYPFKNVTADFLESLGYSISDIGRILKKIC